MSLVDDALARANARQPVRIDYDRMNRVLRGQKAALTRVAKTGDAEKIAEVCKQHIAVWNEIGAWPDDWSHWQRTLNDALPWHQQINLEDL